MNDSDDEHEPASWRAEIIADFRLRGDERCAAASPIPGFPQILDSMLPALQSSGAGAWIDLGGGLGGCASWIARRLDRPVALIDSSASNIRAARRLFPDLAVVASPLDALPLRSESTSVAWMNNVASRSVTPDALLSEVTRILRTTGHLAATDVWAPARRTKSQHRDPLRSFEDFIHRAEHAGLRVTHAAVADPDVGWWSAAEMQVTDEIHRRHHSHPAYPSWQQHQDWIRSALESDDAFAAGLVMELTDP